MIQLRDYQITAVQAVRDAFKDHRRVILQAPTGAGKTAIALHMMSQTVARGNDAMMLVHQRELLSQTAAAFWREGLQHGVIASGIAKTRKPMRAHLAMVQTLRNRIDGVREPGLIVIDEAHRSASKTYRDILDRWPSAYVVGLTATPRRTDGRALDMYEAIVRGPSIRSLIEHGWLCDYEIYAAAIDGADGRGVARRGADYDRQGLATALGDATIYGDAVGHYKRQTPGKRCVVMCASVDLAYKTRDAYRDAGVPAECIEGSMTQAQRDGIIERFRLGDVRVVTNMQLLIEGVDIPGIEVVQWLRPTLSLIVWMQGNGRGFRPAEGKDRLVILDHAGNFARHGLPDDDREWSLDGRMQIVATDDDGDLRLASCAKCFRVYPPGAPNCPYCGHVNETRERRELQRVEAELQRVEREQVAAKREQTRRMQRRAISIEDLVALFASQESRDPAARAAFVFAGRDRRKPTRAEFERAYNAWRDIRDAKS